MTSNEWYRQTAQHMWRTFFRDEASPLDRTNAQQIICTTCSTVLNRFRQLDQDIIRMYYTTPRGMEIHNVENYSLSRNVPTNVIWMIVHRANRAVIEELGILDASKSPKNALNTPCAVQDDKHVMDDRRDR